MTPNNLIPQILAFIFYLVLQIFFVRQLVLFDYAFCFAYVGAILLLPFDTSRTRLIILGFVAGLIVDMFYNTIGANAAAMTLIAYLRPSVITLLMPQRGYDERDTLSLKSMGFAWFIPYCVILVAIHHFVLFFLEASSMSLLGFVLLKTVASAIFTTLVLIIIQLFRKE